MWEILRDVGWMAFLDETVAEFVAQFDKGRVTVPPCDSYRSAAIGFSIACRQIVCTPDAAYGRFVFCQSRDKWSVAVPDTSRMPPGRIAAWTRELSCRGMVVRFAEDTVDAEQRPLDYGIREFSVFERGHRIRHVLVHNDLGGWTFETSGEILPFEHVEGYQRRIVKDRLSLTALKEYCTAIGFNVSGDDALTDECVIFT